MPKEKSHISNIMDYFHWLINSFSSNSKISKTTKNTQKGKQPNRTNRLEEELIWQGNFLPIQHHLVQHNPLKIYCSKKKKKVIPKSLILSKTMWVKPNILEIILHLVEVCVWVHGPLSWAPTINLIVTMWIEHSPKTTQSRWSCQ